MSKTLSGPTAVLAVALAFLLAPATAHAHPIHSSYAEADYRHDPDRLEISIRLFADDAEEMLTKRAGKKISLAKSPVAEVDGLLFASVKAAFIVKSPGGDAQPLEWMGREVTDGDQHLWIYVRCPMPGGVVGARFANRLLRDTFSDQINSIRVRDKGPPLRQNTLLFPNDAEQVAFGKK